MKGYKSSVFVGEGLQKLGLRRWRATKVSSLSVKGYMSSVFLGEGLHEFGLLSVLTAFEQ